MNYEYIRKEASIIIYTFITNKIRASDNLKYKDTRETDLRIFLSIKRNNSLHLLGYT